MEDIWQQDQRGGNECSGGGGTKAVKIEEEKCFLQFAFPRNQSQRLGFRCR